MKKILLLCLMVIAVSSCTITYDTYSYSYQGDVELLSNDGNIIEKWNNAIFSVGDSCRYDEIYNHNIAYKKHGGLEFLSEEGDYMYINGGIIIVRDIRKNVKRNPAEVQEKSIVEDENRDYL